MVGVGPFDGDHLAEVLRFIDEETEVQRKATHPRLPRSWWGWGKEELAKLGPREQQNSGGKVGRCDVSLPGLYAVIMDARAPGDGYQPDTSP